ncbi:MAG: HAMP domain-containing sensor histidine kinase [Synechococcales bacterium]|nr:HAMP domain-containing sensor histidine kinase [Synechococcales bacterium]
MAASSEFLNLCQAQVDLLTHGLGAAFSVVYLTEETLDASAPDVTTRLVPVVAYPEQASQWRATDILAWLAPEAASNFPEELSSPVMQQLRSLPAAQESSPVTQEQLGYQDWQEQVGERRLEGAPPASGESVANVPPTDGGLLNLANQSPFYQGQVVTPLAYQGMVMGLLVTARGDRRWNEQEQYQIERIAQTLASACVLDHRTAWLELELRQQRATYRQLQQQQQDQVDDLLHQIRNPLTALRTFGKLLLKRLEPDDQNRTVAESIVRESDRLRDLLEQFDQTFHPQPLLPPGVLGGTMTVLDGEFAPWNPVPESPETVSPNPLPLPGVQFLAENLQIAPYPVAEILAPLVETAEAIAHEQSIGFLVDYPLDAPPVWVDLRAIREVLSNLIDNALKYTLPPGTVVVLGGVVTPQGQAIVVADTGLGIPQTDQSQLFQRHFRGVQAEGTIPGTGLGLAIARELLHQMRGDIQIVSPIGESQLVPAELKRHADRLGRPGTAAIVWLPERE